MHEWLQLVIHAPRWFRDGEREARAEIRDRNIEQ
jgi:hypothetical protein